MTLSRLIAIGLVLVLLAARDELSAQESEPQDGFRPMFVDAALTGWVRTNTPAETWTLRDGILICTGKPIGEIRTEKMYQNFVMELEWRHMVPAGNAGVFVWADDITARGVPFHRGIEVQVLENAYGDNRSHTTHGDIFPIHGATMTPVNGRGGQRAFPTEKRSHPSPQWNHYRIECVDGAISLAVNGKVVTRGNNCVPRKGYICLESEGGVVHYRNVRIKTLPSTPIDPEQVAIANRGYESIYSGLNLDGWESDDRSAWKPNDWILSHRSNSTAPGMLRSQVGRKRLGFVADVQLKDASSNAKVSAGSGVEIDFSDPLVRPLLQKIGSWNRIEAWPEEGEFVIEVNGNRMMRELEPGSVDSVRQLQLTAIGNVDFCNLYTREMGGRDE